MCVVSAVGDYWSQKLPDRDYYKTISPFITGVGALPQVTRQEFEALKRDVAELKELLVAAKRFDEATGQPDCEMDEKVALIKKVAEIVGVSLEDVFGRQK